MLQALAEGHYVIKSIHGVSAGALNGALYLLGYGKDLREVWTEFIPAWRKSYPWLLFAPIRALTKRRGLVSSDFLADPIAHYITSIPDNLTIDVVSLFDGQLYELPTDEFATVEQFQTALYASCAVPGVFAPVTVGTKSRVIYDAADGGTIRPVPDSQQGLFYRIENYTPILTSDGKRGLKRPKSFFQCFLAASAWQRFERQNDFAEFHDVIRPVDELPSPYDFSKESLTYSFQHGYNLGLQYF